MRTVKLIRDDGHYYRLHRQLDLLHKIKPLWLIIIKQ